MPGLRPVVEGIDTVLMLNDSIAASELFNAFDPDDDPITQYVFSDSGDPSSGFFIFQGIVQPNGVTLTIEADQLDELSYVAGPTVNNESISIRASDGTLLSEPGLVTIYTARTESVRPIAVVDDVTILGNESVLASSFISGFDPDGFPISSFTIRDNLDDRSFFSLDGVEIEQGEFRVYNIDEFNRLTYNAVGRQSETIDVFAFDGSISSLVGSGEVSVRANLNRPVVDFASAITQEALLTPIAPLVNTSDADGNTIKFIELRDRSDRFFSGSLVFEGNDLAPREFHRFTPEELENVFFRGGERSITEQVRVRALDGRFRSAVRTISLDNVAGGGGDGGGGAGVPVLESQNFGGGDSNAGGNVQEQLFFQNVASLVQQTDSGFPGLTFELLDTNPNPVSAAIVLDGVQQPGDTVLSFTDDEYERLQIRTGTFEDRFFDEIYVRTNNGTFNSDWTRLNIMTEPEYFDAFSELDPQGFTVATWDNFIPRTGNEPLEITFSFAQQFPDYNTGEAEDNPNRTPTPRLFLPFTDAQRESTRFLFNHIESFANVDFVEVVDSPLTVDPVSGNRGGTIRLANYYRALAPPPVSIGADPSDDSTTCTQVFGPGANLNAGVSAPEAGDVWVNIDASIAPFFVTNDDGVPAISPCNGLDFLNQLDLGPGTFEYATMLDAIVSAIGEGTPFDIIGGADQNAILPLVTQNDSFTVQAGPLDPFNPDPVSGYALYDVNYLQAIYGANLTFNNGDTLYSISSNLNNGGNSRETIWDADGEDTLSAVGSTIDNVVVDLRPGFFSSIGNIENNLAIAFGAEIENATGSEGNDVLIGNELGNVLMGGDGDDVLRGNGGNDLLTGGASGDTFIFTIADGNNRINEMQLAGRDTIQLEELADLNSFEEDLSFRLDGRDLVIELRLDGSPVSDTTITIEDQTRGSFRIESLNIGTETVDLVNLTSQATGANQSFRLTNESTIFGNLVAPV